MLNAQPIGGKKGSRWRDDVWTMKYLPKFKWNMLTEQIGQCLFHVSAFYCLTTMLVAHEAAIHAARLRVELSQSKREQQEYLKNVELARVLDKRAQRKKQSGGDSEEPAANAKPPKRERAEDGQPARDRKRKKAVQETTAVDETTQKQLNSVLGSLF